MPANYEILSKGQVLIVNYSGIVTARDTLELLDLLEADPAFRPGFKELSDLSAIEQIQVNADDIPQLVKLTSGIYARNTPPSRIAFVLPKSPDRAKVERYATLLAQTVAASDIRTFDTRREALLFLNAPTIGSGKDTSIVRQNCR